MNPQDLLNKAQLMSQQTKAQGSTPFLGSSFDGTVVDATRVSAPTTPLNLKTTPQLQVPNVANLVSSEVANPVAPVVPEPKAPSLTDRIAGLFGQTKNKEADLASAVDTATSPYTKQLNELNTQIKMQQANAIANQEKAMQSGETTGFASREAQNVARTDAIETLKLSALAEGMRGNIALAEQHATTAINAKYAQINADLETAKSNIYDNWESLTPAEKKKAEATLLRIDKEDAFVKMQMEDEKITQGFLQEAIAQSQANGKPIDTLTLSRASKAGTPTEALQILAPYMVDADAKASALLDRQYKQAQLDKIQAEAQKIRDEGKTPVMDTRGRLVMNTEDAQKLNKEIVGTDAYKAITKAKDSLQFLDNFDTQFKDSGTTSAVWSPKENAAIKLKYNSTILNLKEFFNLGVLNGPDETILRGVLPDPSNTSVFNATRGSAVKEGITNMKTMIDQTLDDRYRSIKAQYGVYSPDTVSVLKDLDRVYVEQKARVNPEIARMRKENPNLSDQDIINILGK